MSWLKSGCSEWPLWTTFCLLNRQKAWDFVTELRFRRQLKTGSHVKWEVNLCVWAHPRAPRPFCASGTWSYFWFYIWCIKVYLNCIYYFDLILNISLFILLIILKQSYMIMNVSQVATDKDNGILLYKGDNDPLALELYQGHVRLIYDTLNSPPTTVYR